MHLSLLELLILFFSDTQNTFDQATVTNLLVSETPEQIKEYRSIFPPGTTFNFSQVMLSAPCFQIVMLRLPTSPLHHITVTTSSSGIQ
ncbi:hypothetical protein Patl1_04299 [Pistacia atlantica]|uniref:Uncharacterized protein n=1 Tax=Pistacia atlantica TaxID=434234 RepID=A0ACC1BWG9_9ROSI|nr:hypothetical protein Patl1_04299 [Pistacia atlantica]